jgi:anti-anti-sigma regulatory factor
MLRITVVESSSEAVRLRVEGRVTGRWVEELRKSCDLQALSDGIRLTLDLADVSFVDPAGIELLKELRSRCVTLLSPSPFVAEQLKGMASCDDTWGLDQSVGTEETKRDRLC